ncbi:MAG: hypothetical protein ABUK01_18900 [Leptospirales bacterium]
MEGVFSDIDWKKDNTISARVIRFSLSAHLNKKIPNAEERGSYRNAYRHTLWQATITKEFNSVVAIAYGNLHESNTKNSINLKKIKGIDEADRNVDLLNNITGRQIGRENSDLTDRELAFKVLDYFKNEGLYTAEKNKDGTYRVVKTKLTQKQYDKAIRALKRTDENGRTPGEEGFIEK